MTKIKISIHWNRISIEERFNLISIDDYLVQFMGENPIEISLNFEQLDQSVKENLFALWHLQ